VVPLILFRATGMGRLADLARGLGIPHTRSYGSVATAGMIGNSINNRVVVFTGASSRLGSKGPQPVERQNDNVIIVIGAGSIGQAIVRRVSAGKHVLLADLRREIADARCPGSQ
jgi:hypothetical protein